MKSSDCVIKHPGIHSTGMAMVVSHQHLNIVIITLSASPGAHAKDNHVGHLPCYW